jgi:hypothetical protein
MSNAVEPGVKGGVCMDKGTDGSEDVIGDFGEKADSKKSSYQTGDFGEPPKDQALEVINEIGDFGEVVKPGEESAENIGDFGEPKETATLETEEEFGEFGEPARGEIKGTADIGDFGEAAGNSKKRNS